MGKRKKSKGKAPKGANLQKAAPKQSSEALSNWGRMIGGNLGRALSQAASEKMANNQATKSELLPVPPKSDKTLTVRKPDSQKVAWQPTFIWPVCITWEWNVGEAFKVRAVLEFGDLEENKYFVIFPITDLRYPSSNVRFKGTAQEAKLACEALLSAYDWENSWRKHLGENPGMNTWNDY